MDETREQSILKAVALGGRANGFDLLAEVAHVLAGRAELSPALSAWFDTAVTAIREGVPADEAFGVKRKGGPHDPLDTQDRHAERDRQILELVSAARTEGYPTSPNARKESCFEVAAERLGLPEKTVRTTYYSWEEIESTVWPAPE